MGSVAGGQIGSPVSRSNTLPWQEQPMPSSTQLARRQQAVQMGAVVRRRVRLAVQAGHRELVVVGVEAPHYALGHLPGSGDSLEFHWTLRTFALKGPG